MKILLLGAQGQVGWELQRSLACLGTLVSLDRRTADLASPEALLTRLKEWAPNVIVNAAAHTAVDQAESEAVLCRQVNAVTPGLLAEHARETGALLVHYSTDYVFDGSGTDARTEKAATGPLSVYGATKLEGEQRIAETGCRHLIFRTSWVHGARGGNFAKTMLRLAGERDALNVIADQVGAPTGADLIADVTAHAILACRDTPAQSDRLGLYHLVAQGETSWHGYARFVIEWAHAHGVSLKTPPDAVRAIDTSAYPTPARRPLNSRLDCRKLEQAFHLQLPPWQSGVERMLSLHLGV